MYGIITNIDAYGFDLCNNNTIHLSFEQVSDIIRLVDRESVVRTINAFKQVCEQYGDEKVRKIISGLV